MKVRLINFRCYEDSVFDLNNIVLILADSGQGKSSILLGIQYCLFGTKGGVTIVSYGKTSCSVEIQTDEYTIKRISKPKQLNFTDINGNTLEDDLAQAKINEIFGDCFSATSFVTQNPIGTFMLMGATEKLEFLERFAFKGIDMNSIKARIKQLISQRSENLVKSTSERDVLLQVIKEIHEPEKVKFPYKCKPEERQKVIDTENKNKDKIDKKITKIKVELNALYKEKQQIEIYECKLETLKPLLEKNQQRETNIYSELDDVKLYKKEDLLLLEKLLTNIRAKSKLFRLEKEYDEKCITLSNMRQAEQEMLQKEKDKLEQQLDTTLSDRDVLSLNRYLSSLNIMLKDARNIETLKERIDELPLQKSFYDEEILELQKKYEDKLQLQKTIS